MKAATVCELPLRLFLLFTWFICYSVCCGHIVVFYDMTFLCKLSYDSSGVYDMTFLCGLAFDSSGLSLGSSSESCLGSSLGKGRGV